MTWVTYKQLKDNQPAQGSTPGTRAPTPVMRASTPVVPASAPASRITAPSLPASARSLSRSVSTSSIAFDGAESSGAQDDSDLNLDTMEEPDDLTKRFWLFVDNNLEKIYEDAQGPPSAPRGPSEYKATLNA